MMRSSAMKMWLWPMLTLMLICAGNRAWGQEGNAASAPTSDQSQVSQPSDGGVNWKGVGAGAGAIVSNLVYVPAKLVYGILGGIAGGAGYALTGGNKQVANSIWRSSLGGDYVVTPDMMTGKQPIYFSGPSDAGAGQATAAVNPLPARPATSVPSMASSPLTTNSSTVPATQPIDSGAGLVSTTASPSPAPSAGTSQDYTYGANSRPTAPKKTHLSDSSIE